MALAHSISQQSYYRWDKNTSPLCQMGEQANRFIEHHYDANTGSDFFNSSSPCVQQFQRLVRFRQTHWFKVGALNARMDSWLEEMIRAVDIGLEANNRLGLLKEYVWARYSTVPILQAYAECAHVPAEWAGVEKTIKTQLGRITTFLSTVQAEPAQDIVLFNHVRLSNADVGLKQRQRFLNVYRVRHPKLKRAVFCDVLETWHFNQNPLQVDLCLPLSVGCVAQCAMCEFSLFQPINFPPEVLLQLVQMNLRNNYQIAARGEVQHTVYYLGGGDAMQYKSLPSLIGRIQTLLPDAQQVVSTIGLGSSTAFERFLERLSAVPLVSLQWSLNAFNESSRRVITGGAPVLPVKSSVSALTRFAKKTGTKVTVSILMWEKLNDDVESIKRSIITHLNPRYFSLNFANLQPNQLTASRQINFDMNNTVLCEWAKEQGFEATLDSPQEDRDPLSLCGRVSRRAFDLNRHCLKEEECYA